MIMQVAMPVASNLPFASTNVPRAVASRRPRDTTSPRAVTRPVAGVMARTKLTCRSVVT